MERLKRFGPGIPAPAPPAAGQGRYAFTLVELLTVLVVLGIVSGITITGILTYQRGTRLQAAEQLITDFLRQARHTARSTGAPVILRISPVVDDNGKVVGGEIAGVSQILLASEAFEDDRTWQDPNQKQSQTSSGSAANAKPFAVPGRSGHGLRIVADEGGTRLSWPKKEDDLAIRFAEHDRSKRLVRKRGLTEGFYLAAALRTPPVDEPTVYDVQGRAGRIDPKYEPGYVPVLLLGSDSAQSLEDSVAGLMLRRHQRPLQVVDRADPTTGMMSGQLLAQPLATWEAIGWVKGDDESAMVSSIDDGNYHMRSELHHHTKWSDYTATYPSISRNDPLRSYFQSQNKGGTLRSDTAMDIPAPIGDGRWVELGLLFDGHELMMFLDGVPVSRAPAAATLPFDATRNTLWIGTATLPSLGADAGSGKTIYAAAPAIIDDVRLYRLGTDRPTPLPKGVRPCLPGAKVTVPGRHQDQPDLWYEITVIPDGRVMVNQRTRFGAEPVATVNQDDGRGQGQLRIVLAETSQPEFMDDDWAVPRKRVELTVAVNGRVTRRVYSGEQDRQEDSTP